MKVGLLWFDDSKTRTIQEKVRQAADHYRVKYGRPPSLCLVHPGTLNGGPKRVGSIDLQPAPDVLVHHFFIGIEEDKDS